MKYLKTFEGFSESDNKYFTYAFKIWFDTEKDVKDKISKSHVKETDNLNYRIEQSILELGDNIILYLENHPCFKNINIKGKSGEEMQDIFGTFELNTNCSPNDIVYYINDAVTENEKLDTEKGGLFKIIPEDVLYDGTEEIASLIKCEMRFWFENYDKEVLGVGKNENKSNDDKWAKDVDVEEGKMHKLLNIDKDKNIKDVYTSGKELARDLLKANDGDRKKTSGMLAFAANVNDEEDVFDRALRLLDKVKLKNK